MARGGPKFCRKIHKIPEVTTVFVAYRKTEMLTSWEAVRSPLGSVDHVFDGVFRPLAISRGENTAQKTTASNGRDYYMIYTKYK